MRHKTKKVFIVAVDLVRRNWSDENIDYEIRDTQSKGKKDINIFAVRHGMKSTVQEVVLFIEPIRSSQSLRHT